MLSEFGMQSLPVRESLEQFLPTEKLFPPNASWEYHHAQLEKLWRYAEPLVRSKQNRKDAKTPSNYQLPITNLNLDEFIDATQDAQMHALQIAIEYARRNKKIFSGCLFWQFNEPWPAICWSVVDYYRRPKRAYQKLAQIYQPLLISFAYALQPRRAGDKITGTIWIVNDSLESWPDCTIHVIRNGVESERGRANIPTDSVTRVGNVYLTMSTGANVLRLEIHSGEKILTVNEYDLNYCDVGESSSSAKFYSKLGEWLMK